MKYKNRFGLYILVIAILLSVGLECPGYGDKRYKKLCEKLNKIEAKIDSAKIVLDN